MNRRAIVLLLLALSGACSPSVDDHFLKGNQYLEKDQLDSAILEYRSALRLDPKRADIRLTLADAYVRISDGPKALAQYSSAADLLPNDVATQLKTGNLLLLARAFEDAKARANIALGVEPKNPDALILLGNALAGLKDVNGAMSEYEQAIALDPARDTAYSNIGIVQQSLGNTAAAEASFKKAVAVAPKSIQARLGLANFLWSAARSAEAEQVLKGALALDPSNASVNRMLGMFCIESNRAAEAESYFQAVAQAENSTQATLSLAGYYVAVRRLDDARRVLVALAGKERSFAVATTRIAAIDAAQGKRAQALNEVRGVLARFPKEMPARLLSARLLLEDGQPDEALKQAESIVAEAPASEAAGDALMLIGGVQMATQHHEDAINTYKMALTQQVRPMGAALGLAALHLAAGDAGKAYTFVQKALELQPKNLQARAMAVRVWQVQGQIGRANEELASLRNEFPHSALVWNLVAAEQMDARQVDAARASYARAAELSPNDLEAATGLVRIDLAQGRLKDAVARIEAGLAAGPPSGDLLVVAARTYAATRDFAKTEELLKRAIATFPDQLPAYGLLAQVYVSQHRVEEGKAEFQKLVERTPTSVQANTMLGLLLEALQRLPEAEKQYQAVLALDPTAPVAANNLAWLYVSSHRNLSQALQLARGAQRRLPADPHVLDTLGWAYYNLRMAAPAIGSLESSIEQDPTDPVVHYHLGMSYLLAGDVAKTRTALKAALAISPDFDGAAEARRTLARIGS